MPKLNIIFINNVLKRCNPLTCYRDVPYASVIKDIRNIDVAISACLLKVIEKIIPQLTSSERLRIVFNMKFDQRCLSMCKR